MISFIGGDTPGLSQTNIEFINAMVAKTRQQFGALPIQKGMSNGHDYNYANINELLDQYVLPRELMKPVLVGDQLVVQHFYGIAYHAHAFTSAKLIINAIQEELGEVKGVNDPIHANKLLILCFWLGHFGRIANNLCFVLHRHKDGINIRNGDEQAQIPAPNWREYINETIANSIIRVTTVAEVCMDDVRRIKGQQPLLDWQKDVVTYHAQASKTFQESARFIRDKDSYIYPEQLKAYVEAKNRLRQERSLPHHHIVIANRHAYKTQTMDGPCLHELAEVIKKVWLDQQRTQVTLFPYQANGSRSHAIDISREGNKLVIIHIEPAGYADQHFLLNTMKGFLDSLSIPTEFYACAARLYRGVGDNDLYGYMLSDRLGQTEVAKIRAAAIGSQPQFKDLLECDKTTDLPTLGYVKWFDICALGKKAVMFGRDKDLTIQRLEKLRPGHGVIDFNAFCKQYGLDFDSGRTYIEHRRAQMFKRTKGAELDGLGDDLILDRLGLKLGELDKAFRVLCAGTGPRVYLEYLLHKHPELLNTSGPKSKRTGIHQAARLASPARTALILSKKPKLKVRDFQDKTPEQLVPENDAIKKCLFKPHE